MSSFDESCWVFKVGGSLLEWPALGDRLPAVCRRFSSRPLLVIGGGAVADVVRQWDRVHQLGDPAAHRLAIQAMRLNQALILELLPEVRSVSRPDEALAVWQVGGVCVLNVLDWLLAQEQAEPNVTTPFKKLPESWDVTSDSIAAWVALHWRATLVLLKSIDLSPTTNLTQDGVDPVFPTLASQLSRVYWMNLRASAETLHPWPNLG